MLADEEAGEDEAEDGSEAEADELSAYFGGGEELLSGFIDTLEEEVTELCELAELSEIAGLWELVYTEDETFAELEISELTETDENELSEYCRTAGTSRSRNAAAAAETAIANPAAPAAKSGRNAAFLNLANRMADIT